MYTYESIFSHLPGSANAAKLISETADADLADKLKNIDHQLNYFLDKGIDFKQVVDGIDDSIFITDNKGNVLYVNPAYTRNTGIESERVINHKHL